MYPYLKERAMGRFDKLGKFAAGNRRSHRKWQKSLFTEPERYKFGTVPLTRKIRVRKYHTDSLPLKRQ